YRRRLPAARISQPERPAAKHDRLHIRQTKSRRGSGPRPLPRTTKAEWKWKCRSSSLLLFVARRHDEMRARVRSNRHFLAASPTKSRRLSGNSLVFTDSEWRLGCFGSNEGTMRANLDVLQLATHRLSSASSKAAATGSNTSTTFQQVLEQQSSASDTASS